MKVFVELTHFAATAGRSALRDRVTALEDAGATGVAVSDHVFLTPDGRHRRDGADPGCEPMTTLAAVAGLSDRLELQTVVMNTAWIHPALLLRQFSQLAVLIGGERVTAGLGAGWSTEEFAALGLELPPFRTRMDRLEEVLQLARGLYDRGAVTLEGTHIVARDLPLSPVPEQPPALLVGGGSDRVLRMAGRYADVLDLHGDPRHGRVAGATMAEAAAGDVRRRALTTVEDLARRIELVRRAAEDAGRPRDAVSVSTQIWFTAFGSADDVRAAEQDLCANWAGIGNQFGVPAFGYAVDVTSEESVAAAHERRRRGGVRGRAAPGRRPRKHRRHHLSGPVPRHHAGAVEQGDGGQRHRHLPGHQGVLPDMLDNGWGRIVNMSSVSAQRGGGVFGKVPYSSAKAADPRIHQGPGPEIADTRRHGQRRHPRRRRHHIRVGSTDEQEAKLPRDIPIGRTATPDEVAAVITFLSSDDASYLTGTTLDINGGSHIH